MEITILGSGTGIPSLKRNAAGLIINPLKALHQASGRDHPALLFDTGPGIVKRLLEVGVGYHDIEYIFYTHFHTDHTLDLATFLFAAKYALSLRTKQLNIVGPPGLTKLYQNILGLYEDVIRPCAYEVKLKEIQEESINLNGYKINAMRMEHCQESLGYRVELNGKVVAYSGDTDICENIMRLGQNADVLILDCSFPDEMKVKGHLVAREAAEIARACNCKKLVLSHLYPVCEEGDIKQQAEKYFKGEIIVAYDLLKLSV